MTNVRFFLVAVLAAATVAAADGLPPDRQRAIDEFVGQFVEFAMFDGNIVVDIGGQLVYERSFGYANLDQKVAHDESSRFHLASVSKAITDAALSRLVQDGVLALDTPIAAFLPDFPRGTDITVKHLVMHASGIPHSNRYPWGDGSQSLTIDEVVLQLAQLPLDFEPGTDVSYSNGGYAVLAKVLEIAGDGTFSEVLHATVFDPLDMVDTDHVTNALDPLPKKALGYVPGERPGERREAPYYAIESKPGGGSMYSTTPDMLKFMRAVFRDDFVSAAMRRDVMGEDSTGFLSQGRSPGFVAKAYFDPADDVIVVSLSNSYAVPSDWAAAIAGLATGKLDSNPWPELVRDPDPIATDDPRLGSYAPSYSEIPVVLSRDASGNLLFTGSDGSRNALIPLVGGDFLQPLYFQLCTQDGETRVFTCTMLSGEKRYTSTHTPTDD